jgi:biopolymer transport protein TolR
MAFFTGSGDDDQVLADINVTPLVDVMLVLLIIFMVTAPMLHQGVEVALPQVDAKALPQRVEDPLILSINRDGMVYVKDQPIHPTQLLDRLAPMLRARGDDQLFLKGDRDVPFGKVVEILDLLQKNGITRVGIVTEPPPQRRGG